MAEKKPSLTLIAEAIQELRRTYQSDLDGVTDKGDREYWQRKIHGCDDAILALIRE